MGRPVYQEKQFTLHHLYAKHGLQRVQANPPEFPVQAMGLFLVR
jgi:hypothetical protein